MLGFTCFHDVRPMVQPLPDLFDIFQASPMMHLSSFHIPSHVRYILVCFSCVASPPMSHIHLISHGPSHLQDLLRVSCVAPPTSMPRSDHVSLFRLSAFLRFAPTLQRCACLRFTRLVTYRSVSYTFLLSFVASPKSFVASPTDIESPPPPPPPPPPQVSTQRV